MAADIVVLGSSIPAGVPYVTAAQAFPALIAASRYATFVNSGVSGDTVPQMAARFTTDVLAHSPKWLIIECCHNDATNSINMATFEDNLRDMIEAAFRVDIKTILMTPPVSTTGSIRTAITPYLEVVRALAGQYRLPLVDVYAAMSELAVTNNSAYLALLHDYIHLNVTGHQWVADLFARPENLDLCVIPKDSTGGGGGMVQTYQPTATLITNVAAVNFAFSTYGDWKYYETDHGTVVVFGLLEIDPTAVGYVEVDFTLPVASDFAQLGDLSGNASSTGNGSSQSMAVLANITDNRAKLRGYANSTSNQMYAVSLEYKKI